MKLICVYTCSAPSLNRTQKLQCWKKKNNPMRIHNCVIAWFLFKISGWHCLRLETTWLKYMIFQNLLQGNLCDLFCSAGNLLLVLNELTKIEFMALFSIALKQSWDISPEIKPLARTFLHWGLHHGFYLLLRINFPSDVKDVSVIPVEVVFPVRNGKIMKLLHCPFSWKSSI